MKKIYLNCRFLTQRVTGVQRFAFELCKALDVILESLSEIEVVALMPNQAINPQYINHEFKNIKIHKCGGLSGHLWEQLELPRYSRGSLLINFCNTAPLFKLKQSITLHDVIFMTNQDSQKLWFKLWYRLIARVTSLSAQTIFTVSQFSKAEIVRLLNVKPDRVVVLGNAPSLQNYTYAKDVFTRFKLENKKYFLMIGSNSARKNTQMVTKLFASNHELSEVFLVIVGGKYVNLGAVDELVADNLIYTDYIADSELRSLYAHAEALIFPSFYEGFGIPLVEAMAESTIVIASDIPVIREVCADSALYFDPHSINSLKQQIMLLLDDPNATLIKLKHKTQAQLVNYQWARFAKIMLETIYKNV
jgi:glycosyltransferase involved in cell wall biosynthesis